MKAKGTVHKFGDNVDTDVIIPARYLNKSDEAWLASHCMEDIDADFVNKVKPGDIMVAEANFGCGSSREHAPIAIKASGISCVIASTFCVQFSFAFKTFFKAPEKQGQDNTGISSGTAEQSRRTNTCHTAYGFVV